MERMQQVLTVLQANPGKSLSRSQLAKGLGRKILNQLDVTALALLEERGQIEVERKPDPRPAGVVYLYRVKEQK